MDIVIGVVLGGIVALYLVVWIWLHLSRGARPPHTYLGRAMSRGFAAVTTGVGGGATKRRRSKRRR